jgi:hypothetical protein
LRPERIDQLVSPDQPQPMQDEVRDQQAALAAGQLVVDAASIDFDRQRSA